jgi:2,5-diketo-D-gluconate reductase B
MTDEMRLAYSSPIPQLGLGTFGRTGDAGIEAMLAAIEIGYRHLDTAQTYDTEAQVGAAMRKSGLSRGDFFVTTKVADFNLAERDFMPSVRKSLDAIGVDQVDLLLIHWPSHDDAVPLAVYLNALAEAKLKGYARLIGVSNFTVAHVRRSLELLGGNALATNQVEIHPYLQAPKLSGFARSNGLMLTAYQPLAKGKVGDDPVLGKIAREHGVTAAAVALAFLMTEGHAVIPASSSPANLKANFGATNIRLTAEDVEAIRELDRGYRRINPAKSPHWDD